MAQSVLKGAECFSCAQDLIYRGDRVTTKEALLLAVPKGHVTQCGASRGSISHSGGRRSRGGSLVSLVMWFL